ncbi:VWA domain-containing protein [Rhizobium sp. KVB221]|uniref:VWA domain-containing protein n=1 Tax=Rhizobium setariae TaxID=2801340 RepID=A0A937CP41_9HYPH|nr:VWA domain-containing protein [Rhizobium setariae]MBL0372744.1 VWA domain-containing protein [Rhizobium setariae]
MEPAANSDGIVMPPLAVGDGRFADNIVYFGRVLRRAGLKIGPAAIVDAIEAAEAIGIGSREEFYTALFCNFVKRHEDKPVFDEAFQIFWRPRDFDSKLIQMLSHMTPDIGEKDKPKPAAARVSESLYSERPERPREREEIEIDARFSVSEREVFRKTDFAQMTARELAEARQQLSRLILPMDEVRTRRYQPSNRVARIDPRATLRAAMKTGGSLILPKWRKPKTVHPPLVIIADISGSMSQYTRIFLHFMHVLTERRRRVHTFLFGTRLTNVTRAMRHRDPDEAVAMCSAAVKDWSGGTRIGETLKEFNRLWARRVLSQGAIVLLITDGLERDDAELLGRETDRLHRSCRRLIWLNPLLRYDGFEARARGVRAMVPHVDELRAVHNLEAIGDLAEALSGAIGKNSDPKRFTASS